MTFRAALVLSLSLLFACATPEAPMKTPKIDAQGLIVELSPPAAFVVGQPMRIEMTVSNPTQRTLTFCRYHTPFEGLQNDIFSVSASISDVPYQGKMKKRAPPGPEDFIEVPPGESRSATVDLAEGYTIPEGGFALSYRGTDISGLPHAGPVGISVRAP